MCPLVNDLIGDEALNTYIKRPGNYTLRHPIDGQFWDWDYAERLWGHALMNIGIDYMKIEHSVLMTGAQNMGDNTTEIEKMTQVGKLAVHLTGGADSDPFPHSIQHRTFFLLPDLP